MQETWVQSLVQKDPTCHRACEPENHNSWACAVEPGSHNADAYTCLEPVLLSKKGHCNEKPEHHNQFLQLEESLHSNEDPAQPKINNKNKNLSENKKTSLKEKVNRMA